MRPPWSARSAGTSLFAAYAVASAVPVLALGAVLGTSIRDQAQQWGLEHGRAQAAVVAEMAVAPALRGQDLARGIDAGATEELQTATDLAVFRGSVLRLRVRDFDGDVVFADDGTTGSPGAGHDATGEGVVPVGAPDFRAAALGGTRARLVGDRAGGRAIRVLQPLVADTSGRSTGVLELVLPYDAVAAQVHSATTAMVWRLGLGLGGLYCVLAVISWSTTRRLRREAARAAHASLHDPLTALANRELYWRELEAATTAGRPCAVVLLDLDRFKAVNDSFGHAAGDRLLQAVADRLITAVRPGDVVARMGGDEFALLLRGVQDGAGARDLVERVRTALSEPVVLQGRAVDVGASCGVALHPLHGADVEALLEWADGAMYRSKRSGTGVVVHDAAHHSAPGTAHRTTHEAAPDTATALALTGETS